MAGTNIVEKKAIMASSNADRYLQACDHAFDVYSKNIQSIQKFISENEAN